MAKNIQSTRASLIRLSQIWPADPLRPELSFAGFLAARAEALGAVTAAAGGTSPTATTSTTATAASSATATTQDVLFGKSPLRVQVRALEELAKGKIAERYPLSDTLLRPKAMPDYYEKLVEELRAAPGRSWWQGMVNSWKGYIRLK